MFEPHYQPDPRLPGIGLAFVRHEAGGHRTVEHGGILPGFSSQLFVAPDDGIGVIIDLSQFGLGTCRVAISRESETGTAALHLDLLPLSLHKRPDVRNSRRWVNGALAVGATVLAVRRHSAQHPHRGVTPVGGTKPD